MLVQVEAESTSIPFSGAPRGVTSWFARPTGAGFLIFSALFVITLGLQIASGAYHSEFGGYPDEPAHYVTSVMVRQYLTSGHWLNPVAFAQNYYQHYPKVAFGHWPPVFYVVQSVWMLIFSASRASVRLEVALTTTLLAFSVYSEAKRLFGLRAAFLGSVILIALPVVQMCTDEEMAESLLILFCFWATVYFARFLRSATWRDSGLFGLFVSLAVLTKGNGWLLCGIPAMAILLTRQWRMLLRRSFWLSVGIVAALCVPWQLLTLRAAERGWGGGPHPNLQYTREALAAFGSLLFSIPGVFLAALMIIGIALQVLLPAIRLRHVEPCSASMFGLLVATIGFHSVVPAGVEDRKLALAIPAMIFFMLWGAFWIADHLPLPLSVGWRRGLIATVGSIAFFGGVFSVAHDVRYGYIDAASFIASRSQFQNANILTSSNSEGEGLLISEMVMRSPRPEYTIVRATKVMADVDWGGSNYRSLVTSTHDVLNALEQRHIQLVVVDDLPSANYFAHDLLLWRAIRDNPLRFEQLAVFGPEEKATGNGRVMIYRFHAS